MKLVSQFMHYKFLKIMYLFFLMKPKKFMEGTVSGISHTSAKHSI